VSVGRIRPSAVSLPVYKPGKGAVQAEEEHGITGAIKLASNESPYAPIPAVVKAIREAASTVNRYPDHGAVALRAAIADWLGIDRDRIATGPGSVGLLRQVCMLYLDPGDEAVYPWISFEAYPIFTTEMGATPVRVPLVDHAFDLGAVADAVTGRTKLVLLATPNNPTGTAVSTAAIAGLLGRIPDDVVVVVDEAYREFADPALGDPVADLVPQHRNVVVLRTFSKAYGLAGLRLGYAVGDPELIVDVDKLLLPFSTNSLAQAAALAAIEHVDQIQPRLDLLVAERYRVVQALAGAGWNLPDAQANFVFLSLGARTEEVYLHLERRGVVTRPFPGEGLRVTIGSPEENDRFLATLAGVAAPRCSP